METTQTHTHTTSPRRLPRCERNLAGPEEDCGGRIAYEPCGQPAEWTILSRSGEWSACEEHCREALLDGCDAEGPLGHPVQMDDDGELAEVQP